jgi:hypothetical protein
VVTAAVLATRVNNKALSDAFNSNNDPATGVFVPIPTWANEIILIHKEIMVILIFFILFKWLRLLYEVMLDEIFKTLIRKLCFYFSGQSYFRILITSN